MADDDDEPSPLSAASRGFLQKFLEHVRRAGLPGSQELIKLIEKTLARDKAVQQPGVDPPGHPADEDDGEAADP